MKINFDAKKGTEAVTDILQKTSSFGKKTLSDIQSGAAAFSEKSKQDAYLRRLKKYNPLFPDVYTNSEFALPNMIVIVDDAVRKGIDVCEGAIGWLGNENAMEIMYLYDEAVPMSKLRFVPSAACDAVYYVDPFDRQRFIRTDCIFSKAHEERLAELKHIAHSLGAKSCSIEISETSNEVSVSRKKMAFHEGATIRGINVSGDEKMENDSSYKNYSHMSGRITAQFEGSDTPKKPKLKWFAHDDNIKRLIDMRCKKINSIKSETLELSGSSSATMSQKTARAIDGALGKLGRFKGNSSMESQAVRENKCTLIYCIEF